MRNLLTISWLVGAISALTVTLNKNQNALLSPWVVQDISGYETIDAGRENIAFRYADSNEKLDAGKLDAELSNLVRHHFITLIIPNACDRPHT